MKLHAGSKRPPKSSRLVRPEFVPFAATQMWDSIEIEQEMADRARERREAYRISIAGKANRSSK